MEQQGVKRHRDVTNPPERLAKVARLGDADKQLLSMAVRSMMNNSVTDAVTSLSGQLHRAGKGPNTAAAMARLLYVIQMYMADLKEQQAEVIKACAKAGDAELLLLVLLEGKVITASGVADAVLVESLKALPSVAAAVKVLLRLHRAALAAAWDSNAMTRLLGMLKGYVTSLDADGQCAFLDEAKKAGWQFHLTDLLLSASFLDMDVTETDLKADNGMQEGAGDEKQPQQQQQDHQQQKGSQHALLEQQALLAQQVLQLQPPQPTQPPQQPPQPQQPQQRQQPQQLQQGGIPPHQPNAPSTVVEDLGPAVPEGDLRQDVQADKGRARSEQPKAAAAPSQPEAVQDVPAPASTASVHQQQQAIEHAGEGKEQAEEAAAALEVEQVLTDPLQAVAEQERVLGERPVDKYGAGQHPVDKHGVGGQQVDKQELGERAPSRRVPEVPADRTPGGTVTHPAQQHDQQQAEQRQQEELQQIREYAQEQQAQASNELARRWAIQEQIKRLQAELGPLPEHAQMSEKQDVPGLDKAPSHHVEGIQGAHTPTPSQISHSSASTKQNGVRPGAPPGVTGLAGGVATDANIMPDASAATSQGGPSVQRNSSSTSEQPFEKRVIAALISLVQNPDKLEMLLKGVPLPLLRDVVQGGKGQKPADWLTGTAEAVERYHFQPISAADVLTEEYLKSLGRPDLFKTRAYKPKGQMAEAQRDMWFKLALPPADPAFQADADKLSAAQRDGAAFALHLARIKEDLEQPVDWAAVKATGTEWFETRSKNKKGQETAAPPVKQQRFTYQLHGKALVDPYAIVRAACSRPPTRK